MSESLIADDYAAWRFRQKEARKKKPRVYKESNIWTYRAAAVQWLRYTRQCFLVSIERGMGPCTPDVIGCDKNRFLCEVEIKRTVADFRLNASKPSMQRRELLSGVYPVPKFFYFLVDPEIAESVHPEVTPPCGLLTFGDPSPYGGIPKLLVLKNAASNPLSRKLTAREAVAMAKAQSGSLFSILKSLHKQPSEEADGR